MGGRGGPADQRGSILIIVVLVMMALGVMGASFVLLGSLETRVGVNQKAAAQALALAEAGLEHGRDQARALAGAAIDFSDSGLVGNASDGSMLIANAALGDGTYSVRIDNDCAPAVRSTLAADAGCGTHTDANQRVVLTAWATQGTGRARVRSWLEVLPSWKHVCYSGDGTLCTQEPSASPGASVVPSDPNALHGPATGTLPVPSTLACGAAIRRTAQVSFGAGDCVINPYYDWALDTACPAAQCSSSPRAGCAGHTGLTGDFCPDTGLVFYGCYATGPSCTAFQVLHAADILISGGGGAMLQCAGDHIGENHPGCPGTANVASVVYVMGKASLGSNGEVNGTLVVHGDGVGGSTGPAVDMSQTGHTGVWASGSCVPGSLGYPLAILIYDPSQTTLPQNTFANVANSNGEIHGIVYSAGEVSFNPASVDGGVVAWKAYLQNGASSLAYNECYGKAAPPPGFSSPPGSQTVTIDRRTWSQCRVYSATEATAPTACD
jgi:Tfp pilus assembly protein PilX